MIYGVISDIHAHLWSTFASSTADGANSRLSAILSELRRAAQAVANSGGDTLVVAGDIFHTRGNIDPEVLNPVRAVFHEIADMGISVLVIPGNHDLKSSDTREVSSAVQNLEHVNINSGGSIDVYNRPTVIEKKEFALAMVPWRETLDDLLGDLETLSKHAAASQMDVFIHAGIDGVLSGIPGHGLTAGKLAAYGFRRVFAGHYHNHRDMGSGVYSIGATTHQTWSDVGTRAGFLLVDGATGAVTFNDTVAPKFVDISGLDEMEIELACKGNFVRFRGPQMTQSEINEFRDQIRKWGAIGIQLEVPKATAALRTTTPAKGLTLAQSVEKFIDGAILPAGVDKAAVQKRAQEVLNAAQAVVEEA